MLPPVSLGRDSFIRRLVPMSPSSPPPLRSGKHFTPFRTVAEEAQAKKDQQESAEEGGHMSSTCGRVLRTPEAKLPYKVVLTHDGRAESAHSFASMHEAESFIRRNTPVPPVRSTLRDHDTDQSLPVHGQASKNPDDLPRQRRCVTRSLPPSGS